MLSMVFGIFIVLLLIIAVLLCKYCEYLSEQLDYAISMLKSDDESEKDSIIEAYENNENILPEEES